MSQAPEHERRFELFGSNVRLLIGGPERPELPSPRAIALQIEGFLRVLHRRLTRFDQESELCALNADPRSTRRVSTTLALAVQAAVWAAQRSGGLIDPTVLRDLEQAGYASSRSGQPSASIVAALECAPDRRPARPRLDSNWHAISSDPALGSVSRPPGVRIDLGGTAKGLAADLAFERLAGYSSAVVDAGGDIRVGGTRPQPRIVRIAHPLANHSAHELGLVQGAIATSGIKTRLWDTEEGFAHHLIDPATGRPAWTGVIQATSLGGSALEAETLAKMAFLLGPGAARFLLRQHGGLIVLDDGSVELFGRLARMKPARDPVPA